VGIVTNAGGLGIMCADAGAGLGLETPVLSSQTKAGLAGFLPAASSTANPVDMIASAGPDDYERTIRIVAGSGEVDALIVIFIPPLARPPSEIAEAMNRAAGSLGESRPVLGVFTGGDAPTAGANGTRVAIYSFPEDAARALARATKWAKWRSWPEDPPWRAPDAQQDEARARIAAALGRGQVWLDPEAIQALLSCYGMRLLESRVAATAEVAAAAAREIGAPVALKAYGPGILHKTEARAVALALPDPSAVESAAHAMAERLRRSVLEAEGFLLQRMAGECVEMIVGVVQDPPFGPVIACGAGGTAAELVNDVSVRLTPLNGSEADEMIRSLATFPLLDGYRGRPKMDVASLRGLVLRLGALAEDLPQVVDVDLNPVVVGPNGADVVDARSRVEQRDPPPPEGARPRPAYPPDHA